MFKLQTRLVGGLGCLQFFLAVEITFAVGDPRRGWFIFQVVAEPREDAALVIDLIGFFAQAVIFSGVFEKHDIFLGAARDVI